MRLETEYRSADRALLQLVAAEVRRTARTSSLADLDPEHQALVDKAVANSMRLVVRWQAGHTSSLGLVARQAVVDAVAAHALRSLFPDLADHLCAPWETAVRIRNRLRELGPEVQETALRMLPSWRLGMDELVAAARVIAQSPGESPGLG
jgi:hypothetical protein